MSEWKKCKLGEVLCLINGFAFKGSDFLDSGVPVIKIKNVKPGKILLDNLSYVSELVASDKERYYVKSSDILITMSGNRSDGSPDSWVGKASLFKMDGKFLLNQRVGILRQKINSISIDYIAYILSSMEYQQHFINLANSSGGQANISPDTILNTIIELPPLPEQRAIAGVLSCLDDKIDLLHRQNKTLEAMAEAFYWYFFVNGRKVEWKECTISELATHEKQNMHPHTNKETLFYHYSISAFDETLTPSLEPGIMIKSNKYRVKKNTILFSKLNPHKDKRIWLIPDSINDNSICSTEFQVMNPRNDKYLYFLYGFISYSENYDEIAAGVGGTSSSHQRVDPKVIFNFPCFIPDDSILADYNEIVGPIFGKMHHNRKTAQVLSLLRNILLPKLMSGEVRVKYN